MNQPSFNFVKQRPVDLICMGRVAVDLYSEDIGFSLADAHHFKKYLGGCAGNIAVGAARLGLTCQLLSCIGKDEMGRFIKETLLTEGVLTDLLYETPDHLTGLVMLGVKPPHSFPLMFYRENCADMQLQPKQVHEGMLAQSNALLITGTGLSQASMRETTLYSVDLAKKHETAVIMDLDYRPVLWGLTSRGNGETRYVENPSVSTLYQAIIPSCDLIVGTEDEFCLAGGHSQLAQALQNIKSLTKATLVVKTGENGCDIYPQGVSQTIHGEAFPVTVLNVLGAGDAFMAGLLRGLLRGESFEKAASYGNACGALVVTRHGCAPAIPSWQELCFFMSAYKNNADVWKSQALSDLHTSSTPQPKTATLIKRPQGFSFGYHPIINTETTPVHGEMNFSTIKLSMGETYSFHSLFEFAAILLTGRVKFEFDGKTAQVERTDYFRTAPIALHCPTNTDAAVTALTDCELLIIETVNDQWFEPMLFEKEALLEFDHRGENLLDNTAYRHVRTIFDKRNRPKSNLVVGEIITLPGRWSSYPSHYHAQPEIYHYRFSEPQGFAFAEDGKKTLRIEHQDTYQILQGGEHAHCVAPGYALYTLWVIRHLEQDPYHRPTFRPEHAWTKEKGANWRVWRANKEESHA